MNPSFPDFRSRRHREREAAPVLRLDLVGGAAGQARGAALQAHRRLGRGIPLRHRLHLKNAQR